MVRRTAPHRGPRFQIGEQVAYVVERHALIRRVGKGGIEMLAGRRRALAHGSDEVRLAPGADTVFAVRGNVRRIECAERRLKSHAAAELDRILLAIAPMT